MRKYLRKIKKVAKRGLATALTGIILATSAYAQPVEIKTPKTRIEIPFGDPRKDAYANTKATVAAERIFGNVVDYGFEKLRLKDSIFGRIAEAGVDAWGGKISRDWSHENGHLRIARESGAKDIRLNLNLSLKQSSYDYEKLDKPGNRILEIIAGPNQDNLNLEDSFEKSQLGTSYHYDGIFNRVTAAFQLVNLWETQGAGGGKNGNDYIQYVDRLRPGAFNRNGYKISLDQLRLNATLPILWNLGKSAKRTWNFIKDGKREFEPNYFRINKNWKVGIPGLFHFLTPNGEFLEISEFAKWKDKTFEFNFISDLDFTQENTNVNTLGFGGKIYDISLTDKLSVSPSAGIYLERNNLSPKGFHLGARADYNLGKYFSFLKGEYNQNSVTAETAGKGNGFHFTVGAGFNF